MADRIVFANHHRWSRPTRLPESCSGAAADGGTVGEDLNCVRLAAADGCAEGVGLNRVLGAAADGRRFSGALNRVPEAAADGRIVGKSSLALILNRVTIAAADGRIGGVGLNRVA